MQKLMMLVSLLFIKCFSVHLFCLEIQSTMHCSEMNATSQTGASLGYGELVTAQTLWCYFYFLEGEWVGKESLTPAKIKWL